MGRVNANKLYLFRSFKFVCDPYKCEKNLLTAGKTRSTNQDIKSTTATRPPLRRIMKKTLISLRHLKLSELSCARSGKTFFPQFDFGRNTIDFSNCSTLT